MYKYLVYVYCLHHVISIINNGRGTWVQRLRRFLRIADQIIIYIYILLRIPGEKKNIGIFPIFPMVT